jgi:ribosomal protein S18 acetylase RimI-like enzyme
VTSEAADVQFRDATADDAAALSDFWRTCFCATFAHLYRPEDLAAFLAASYSPAQQYAEILDNAAEHRLALMGGAVVGACQIGKLGLPIDPGPAQSLELKRLYLIAEMKGAGVGQALMDWAVDRARARGATRLYLGVWRENHRAQRFYARNGFEKVSEYHFPVGGQMDEEDIVLKSL